MYMKSGMEGLAYNENYYVFQFVEQLDILEQKLTLKIEICWFMY